MKKIREGDEIIGIICGGSKCGKTTLAKGLVSGAWRHHGLRSIVFDPFKKKKGNVWPASAWVSDDLEAFKRVVFQVGGCLVVWDESSDSLDRGTLESRKFFTRVRHEHPAFFLICHDFTVPTPMMRANITDAYIFRQPEERAEDWRKLFADEQMRQTADLVKREFIHKVAFEPIRRRLPSLEEISCVPLM